MGDLDEAKSYRSQRLDQQQLLLDGDKDDEDADSQDAAGCNGGQDSNANADEAGGSGGSGGSGGGKKNKRKGAKMNAAAADEEKLRRIFAAHPLSVELEITLDADSTIKVEFDRIHCTRLFVRSDTGLVDKDLDSCSTLCQIFECPRGKVQG